MDRFGSVQLIRQPELPLSLTAVPAVTRTVPEVIAAARIADPDAVQGAGSGTMIVSGEDFTRGSFYNSPGTSPRSQLVAAGCLPARSGNTPPRLSTRRPRRPSSSERRLPRTEPGSLYLPPPPSLSS